LAKPVLVRDARSCDTPRMTSRFAPSWQPIFAGALACFVGFAGSFAVVVQGFIAVGATQAQAASGLLALCVAMGIGGIWLSLRTRMPVSIAWSTPGGPLLVATGAVSGGFEAAVGAFILTAVMITVAGFWKPLGRWVASIPPAVANAMLAGVLLSLCLAPVKAVAELPMLALPIVLVWAIVAKFNRLFAIPAALVVIFVVMLMHDSGGLTLRGSLAPAPVLVVPTLTLGAVIGIALPLFLVTMASQNIPGIAVLNANGYRPEPSPLFAATGILGLLAAPFGANGVNLAAITAALCAGETAGPDRDQRWKASVVAGAGYIVFGLGATAATALLTASPPILIEAVAGLALLGSFGSALLQAVKDDTHREAAIITFLISGSGLTFFTIGAPFWGLLAGGALLLWMKK
jgi:benzoate membrane transport protein